MRVDPINIGYKVWKLLTSFLGEDKLQDLEKLIKLSSEIDKLIHEHRVLAFSKAPNFLPADVREKIINGLIDFNEEFHDCQCDSENYEHVKDSTLIQEYVEMAGDGEEVSQQALGYQQEYEMLTGVRP